jgi:hypothetical protein
MNASTNPEGPGPEWIRASPPKSVYSCRILDLKALIQLLVSDTTDFNTISVLSGIDEKAFSLLKAGRQVHLTFVNRHKGPLRAQIADLLSRQQIQPLHSWKVAVDFEFSTYELPATVETLYSICQSILTTAFALPESQELRIKLY